MGLTVGLLKFCLNCIDGLAWPSFALGYPLYASIRAIETNSNYHMRKLVTYWIIFTLISLFEFGFAKLIEWVPLWPYVKLIAISSLVIPHFNGAFYVYQSFIHPCLYMDLQVVIRQLNKPNVQICFNKDTIPVEAKKYHKENGSKDLEKLIGRESTDAKPNLYEEEIKAISTSEKKEMATTTQANGSTKLVQGVSFPLGHGPKFNSKAFPTMWKRKDLNFVQKDVRAVEPTKTSVMAAAKKHFRRLNLMREMLLQLR